MFDWKKPTAQMLGRWQPWHHGHTELFKRALAETGQVCIMIRDVGGIVGEDAGAGRTVKQDDNPFSYRVVRKNIEDGLTKHGFTCGVEYEIVKKSGSWFSYGETKLGQGRDAVKELIGDNPELMDELEDKIKAVLKDA